VSVQTQAACAIRPRPRPLPPRLTEEDERAHRAFLATLGAQPLWTGYVLTDDMRRAS
jgi:DNA polymerase-3 subunit epsilon